MTNPLIIPSQAALAELTAIRAAARRRLALGEITPAQATSRIARWCAIAAWFGAVLPEELRPYHGQQNFTDWAARGQSVEAWRREIAEELRAETERALARHNPPPLGEVAAGTADGGVARTRALLTLDRALAHAAGLPPLGAAKPLENAA